MAPQALIQPPQPTSGPGYSLLYATYLHSSAWVLRKAMVAFTGSGQAFDKTGLVVETPGLGEGHVRVSVCLPKNPPPGFSSLPLLIVAQGGGFVLGQPSDGDEIDRRLADALNAVVIDVEYAKAPRYPYPHALLQLHEVLRWATSSAAASQLGVSVDPARVAVMGNSAGGNLAAVLSLLLSFTGGPCAKFRQALPKEFRLVAQVLLYPSTAVGRPYLDRWNAGAVEEDVKRLSLPVWAASVMEDSYLPPHVDRKEIFVVPLEAEVELLKELQLPGVLCVTAGWDCLKLEAKEYVARLREAGVEVREQECEKALHGFSHHRKYYAEDRERCWGWVEEFLREKFAM